MKENTTLGFNFPEEAGVSQFLLEAIGSFFLVFAYYMLLLERNAPKYVYAVGIAGVYFVDILFLHNKTGCCVNPAKYLAYALVGGKFNHWFVYLFGPFVGGVLGSILGNVLLSEKAVRFKERKKEIKRKRRLT